MLRILIVECLFSALLGAVIFRLAYAFLQKRCCAWVIALLTALLLGIGVSGVLDPYLVRSLAETSIGLIPPPWFSQLSRSLCYLVGAWLADRVVRRWVAPGFWPEGSPGSLNPLSGRFRLSMGQQQPASGFGAHK